MSGYNETLGGVGNYAISLLNAWPRRNPFLSLRIFCTKNNFHLVQKRVALLARLDHVFLPNAEKVGMFAQDCDLVFYPCAHLDPIPPPNGTIFHLADLQEWFFPENFSNEELCRRRNRYRSLLAYSRAIFVPSEFTRQCVLELLKFDPKKVFLVPVISSDLPKSGKKPSNLTFTRYLYYPADDYLHKNHDRLIGALEALKSEGIDVPLVCTGSLTRDNAWLEMAKKADLSVVHLGRVSRDEVRWLYDNAQALVFPSYFEGFGIPLIEAFQCEIPVICSRFSSLPEVAGAAAKYFDPFSVADIATAIRDLWLDPRLLEDYAKLSGQRNKCFRKSTLLKIHEAAFQEAHALPRELVDSVQLPEFDPSKAWALVGRNRPFIEPAIPIVKRLKKTVKIPIHFFSIVLNGMPFLRHQWQRLEKIDPGCVWHIVEGLAQLTHDTAWSVSAGGCCPPAFHKNGLSVDGTTEYVNELAERFPERVKVYRNPLIWNGKREMVEVPMSGIDGEAILWQLDVDEFWEIDTIHAVINEFSNSPGLNAAQFFCRFFVSPERVLDNFGFYGNNPAVEWRRVWRYRPGDSWKTHEPPVLQRGGVDLFSTRSLSSEETYRKGWTFDHLAYVREEQVAFKESYYGYHGAVARWNLLRSDQRKEVPVSEYLNWVPRDLWGVRDPQLFSDEYRRIAVE